MMDDYDDGEKIEIACKLLQLVAALIDDETCEEDHRRVEVRGSHLKYWRQTINICFGILEPMIDEAKEKMETDSLLSNAKANAVADSP